MGCPASRVRTSRNSLFGNSRQVAPVCLSKPPPQPENKTNINNHSHAGILPQPHNNNEQFNQHVFLPQVPDIAAKTVAESSDDLHLSSGDEDIPDEVFSGLLQDLAQSVGVWEHTLHSDVDAVPPPRCQCHGAPSGSCPAVKKQLVNIISMCREFSAPNMDLSLIHI